MRVRFGVGGTGVDFATVPVEVDLRDELDFARTDFSEATFRDEDLMVDVFETEFLPRGEDFELVDLAEEDLEVAFGEADRELDFSDAVVSVVDRRRRRRWTFLISSTNSSFFMPCHPGTP